MLFRSLINDIKKQIEESNVIIANLEKTNNNLTAKNQEYESEIKNLQNSIEDIEKNKNGLSSELESNKSELVKLQNKIGELEQNKVIYKYISY